MAWISLANLTQAVSEIKSYAVQTFAALSHEHSAADITDGTLTVARGGTGQYSIDAARSYLGNIPLMVCTTASGTAAKAVTKTGFELFNGARIAIKFQTGSTATSALTLNVNSTGAYDVYVNGSATSSSNQLTCLAGDILEFYFDDDHWNYVGLADQQKALETDLASVRESVSKYVHVPYSSFTWNSDGNRFETQNYSIPSGYTLAGVLVMPINGGAIMQGYVMSGYLRIVGWVPFNATNITSNYQFECYLVCLKNV